MDIRKAAATRDFSRSTDGPSGEIFKGGKKKASAKIRFKDGGG